MWKTILWIILVQYALLRTVLGMPTLLVNSGRAKCVSVEGPQDTVVRVQYEAMDIILDQNNDNYGPTYLTVNTNPSKRVMDTALHMAPVKQRLKPLSITLKETSGSVMHRFEVDGTVNICIRSSNASNKNPQRFGLRVETSEQDPKILLPSEDGGEMDDDNPTNGLPKTDLSTHLTHMEKELQRITIAMNHVLKEADFNKDQDALFHKQTLAMHSATTFWPIVQVCVLLITGFTQASHIVRFFKSRRII